MKILHISKFYPPEPGGIENFVYDLANAQVRQGHDVTVLCHQADEAAPTLTETIHGATIVRVKTLGQLAYAPVTPAFLLHLHRTIRRFQPDVIHAHLPNVSAFWLLFCLKTCPLILHWHADVAASKIDRKMSFLYQLYKPWESALLSASDRIICTSGTYLKHSMPLRPWLKKCRVVPLGLDPERLKLPDNKQQNLHQSDLTVLCVGRFAYYKGFSYLVDAIEKLPDARLIIVGDGPEFAHIKNRVAQKNLTHRVFLPGKVNNDSLFQLYNECDIFCLPSIERTEAFGLVLLEAMFFGKPLVTAQIQGSGVMEVNQHEITGLQVPVADAGALREAILYLKEHVDIRLKMGRAGRRRFNQNFHIRAVTEKIIRLYQDSLTGC